MPVPAPVAMKEKDMHTPGPWQIEPHASARAGYLRVTDAVGKHIADIFPYSQRAPEYDEALANTNLIAAAPDLLAALQAVVAIADRDTDEFAIARAALSKAQP